MQQNYKTAVLLVNLGTPRSYELSDVRRYLKEFLLDPRVLDIPYILRQLLVRGLILPFRAKKTASHYEKIWDKDGSPLLFHTKNIARKLTQEFPQSSITVDFAMRYGDFSLKEKLSIYKGYSHIIIVPLFPQYASATTGSILEQAYSTVAQWKTIPKLSIIRDFFSKKNFINSFCENAKPFLKNAYDHYIMSFHGLPVKHIIESDPFAICLKDVECCNKNPLCYRADCIQTAHLIAHTLNIPNEKYTICFQSRFGKQEWITPYTDEKIDILVKQGQGKKVLVFSPSFVCDCIETLHELKVELKEKFLALGGEMLDVVPCPNDHELFIQLLKDEITRHVAFIQ